MQGPTEHTDGNTKGVWIVAGVYYLCVNPTLTILLLSFIFFRSRIYVHKVSKSLRQGHVCVSVPLMLFLQMHICHRGSRGFIKSLFRYVSAYIGQ